MSEREQVLEFAAEAACQLLIAAREMNARGETGRAAGARADAFDVLREALKGRSDEVQIADAVIAAAPEARLEAAERLYLRAGADLAKAQRQRDDLLEACEALIDAFGPIETWDGRTARALGQAMAAISRAREDR